MTIKTSTPWHRASFERLLKETLPTLLNSRLPLAGYRFSPTGRSTCAVAITLKARKEEVEIEYNALPQPDEEGVFEAEGVRKVVVPTASGDDLDRAEIRCVGEQLYDLIEERLGQAPASVTWDAALARSWLPLDGWMNEFLQTMPTAQPLDEQNWLSRQTHLRRLLLPAREKQLTPGQFGRTCPFETPEGPNIGRMLTIAVGAEIRDRRLIITDGRPEAGLGLTASMVPFLEHNDANRQLMGMNMMRQWLAPPDPEPACVRTGNEPDAPGFWCGRNLLTAYVSWGAEAYEDAIVISRSCAQRLAYPRPVEAGDKLSNRHGSKGTVSVILPDDEMPHLPDGTPVEIVFSFIGCHARLNFGQMREALMGRIARAEGRPAVVPPFHAPGEKEIRERLAKAGLPVSGMEALTLGLHGKKLRRPSLVGWVYWGKTHHLAREKIHATADDVAKSQRQGELEYYALKDAGAFENLAETFNTRSAERDDATTLAARAAVAPVEQAGPPTPSFAELARRLAVGGISAQMEDGKLTFRFARPRGKTLKLACPVPHPWMAERELEEIGAFEEAPEYRALVEANSRAERLFANGAPESLRRTAREQVERSVKDLFAALLTPQDLRLGGRVLFSGRAVLSPAVDLRLDQVGIADEIAWTLFSPWVLRELGDPEAVRARTPRAAEALDKIMARSWVLVNRAPTFMPTSILAFHPVRRAENVIRLHPLACMLMNADFDGDQAAAFLPLTEAAQREAGERLSVAGHLKRDPALIRWLAPAQEGFWGLAGLSLAAEGRREIESLVGTPVAAPEGFITREALTAALRAVLEREGADAVIEKAERLLRRGLEVAKESGASMNPFIGTGLKRPQKPATKDSATWNAYSEEVAERIASRSDFAEDDMGPQLLAVKSGARGNLRQITWLAGVIGMVKDVSGGLTPIRHALREGLTSDESFTYVVGAREGLARVEIECAREGYGLRETSAPKGFNVMVRAMRAQHPGLVFATAAATGEQDPLADLDTRLFLGLPARLPG